MGRELEGPEDLVFLEGKEDRRGLRKKRAGRDKVEGVRGESVRERGKSERERRDRKHRER